MQRNVVGVQLPSHVGNFATPWTTACQASLCYKGLKRNDKGLKNCVHAQLGQTMNGKIQNREGNGTPLQYFCLENPMDGGAW